MAPLTQIAALATPAGAVAVEGGLNDVSRHIVDGTVLARTAVPTVIDAITADLLRVSRVGEAR
jgi:hypothetical protein